VIRNISSVATCSVPTPARHAKKYADIAKALQLVRELRIKAIREFVDDVKAGVFREGKHAIDVPDAVFEEFRALIEPHRLLAAGERPIKSPVAFRSR
jgi:hypothetical protein